MILNKIRIQFSRLHWALLKLYDRFTAKTCEVSVGDIILKRAELDHCQFLLTTRRLDVATYVSGSDKSFPYQNIVSRAVYGTAHKEERGNMHFTNLIESYLAKGYDPASFLTVDKEGRLIDGNHRMGVNLFLGIERLNVRYLKRKSNFPRNLDGFLKLGISSVFMEEVYNEYWTIQEWLVKSGNTFCCLLKGEYENGEVSLLKDISLLTNIFAEQNISATGKGSGEVFLQFSLNFPSYCVKNGQLYSLRAAEIEQLLNMRKKKFGLDVYIRVSKNCLEGKEMWKEISK